MNTPAEIRRIMKEHPGLTWHGFERPFETGFAERRGELLTPSAFEHVVASLAYLARVGRTAKVSKRAPHSYALKHRAAESSRARGGISYVSNGTFLVACLISGVALERPDTGSPNARVGVRVRDVDAERVWVDAVERERARGTVIVNAGATA